MISIALLAWFQRKRLDREARDARDLARRVEMRLLGIPADRGGIAWK